MIDISINIEQLSQLDNSGNLSDAFILLTEIKQDCMMIIDLNVYFEGESDKTLALSDLLGYIYYYIDDIKPEKANKESLAKYVDELVQINNTFSRVNIGHFESQDEYLKFLIKEIEKNIERYPENTILDKYSNRKLD